MKGRDQHIRETLKRRHETDYPIDSIAKKPSLHELQKKTSQLEKEQKLMAMQMLHDLEKERQQRNEIELKNLQMAVENTPLPKWVEICSLCKSDQHSLSTCPKNSCKSCGKQGHQVITSGIDILWLSYWVLYLRIYITRLLSIIILGLVNTLVEPLYHWWHE